VIAFKASLARVFVAIPNLFLRYSISIAPLLPLQKNMFLLLYLFVQAIQPLLVPLCFLLAWGIVILFGWTLWSALHDAIARAEQMHQIPCTGCQFFTNNHRLKCTIQPRIANTESAINCPDYRSQ
jgi:hypothetical protein